MNRLLRDESSANQKAKAEIYKADTIAELAKQMGVSR